MKKKNMKRLGLNRETVRALTETSIEGVAGGASFFTCNRTQQTCPRNCGASNVTITCFCDC